MRKPNILPITSTITLSEQKRLFIKSSPYSKIIDSNLYRSLDFKNINVFGIFNTKLRTSNININDFYKQVKIKNVGRLNYITDFLSDYISGLISRRLIDNIYFTSNKILNLYKSNNSKLLSYLNKKLTRFVSIQIEEAAYERPNVPNYFTKSFNEFINVMYNRILIAVDTNTVPLVPLIQPSQVPLVTLTQTQQSQVNSYSSAVQGPMDPLVYAVFMVNTFSSKSSVYKNLYDKVDINVINSKLGTRLMNNEYIKNLIVLHIFAYKKPDTSQSINLNLMRPIVVKGSSQNLENESINLMRPIVVKGSSQNLEDESTRFMRSIVVKVNNLVNMLSRNVQTDEGYEYDEDDCDYDEPDDKYNTMYTVNFIFISFLLILLGLLVFSNIRKKGKV